MNSTLIDWFASLENRQGGDILAVQTLRNALMAASVLASAALVGLMGVLATAHLHPKWSSGSAAAMLVVSAVYSLRALWTLSRAGFEIRLESQALSTNKNQLLEDLTAAIAGIRWAGILLILALAAAGASIWLKM
jgi:membrane protein YdbS with pleckstrin-like domain